MSSSELGDLLLCQWEHLAASAGVLRTTIDDTRRRCVPGSLGLVVQFNPSHIESKRPVDPQLLKASTDESAVTQKTLGFNFTLAKKAEYLCGLRFKTHEDQRLPSVQATGIEERGVEHFVLVNVAPLVRGHVLFVLDMDLVNPQSLTKKYMHYALGISRAIQREDFALGFNSAGAWSSVNHLHLHGYFFPQREDRTSANFPVASQTKEVLFRVGGTLVNRLPDWAATCFVIEAEDAANDGVEVAQIAWTLLELLQSRGTPHNLLVVDMKVFIYPRQPQCENGTGLSSSYSNTMSAALVGRLRIAVAELSGLVVVGDRADYENLTEETFSAILDSEVSLSAAEEAALVATWKENIRLRW
ncbi:unnamed protein product [Hyaloperonospora brassicae]|uniref:GDP-D-glucose phosphorylase 1 n=1 Tax=Hyaloperonospora brassicae TaxID=162125 RepID=A0AAV0T737_HYABA|nr:unnamed protein product [Hyaloperonospora brassicae]